jgi:hypothetical protein
MFVLALVALTPVAYGANSQGLHYGVREGDRLDYAIVMRSRFPSVIVPTDDRLYVIVDSLGPIPDRVSIPEEFELAVLSFYWANGSEINSSSPYLQMRIIVLPIGNWSLASSVLFGDPPPPNSTVIDNETLFGLRAALVNSFFGFSGNMSLAYLKSDGSLNRYWLTLYSITNGSELMYYDLSRLKEGTGQIAPLTLISIAAIPILVVAAVLLIWRYRH